MDLNEINKLRLDILRMFGKIDPLIKEKFSNVCNKTSQYKVPDALFQNRTDRKNRVLLPFKSIINNNITVENLSDFSGGLCVEFVNDDYFNEEYRKTEQFRFLSALIGGNGIISSIISFRTEEGDPGATIPRQCWEEYITEGPDSTFSITDINGQNLKLIPITRNQEVIDKIKARGSGLHIGRGTNELWKGNAFWEIKGGDQTSIQSHATNAREALFNPATDFANEIVTLDITITMSFFCYALL